MNNSNGSLFNHTSNFGEDVSAEVSMSSIDKNVLKNKLLSRELFGQRTNMSSMLLESQKSGFEDLGEACMSCRGKGLPGGCPTCGKDSTAMKVVSEITDEMLEELAIPVAYKNIEWNPDILISDHPKYKDSTEFKRYVGILTSCISACKSGFLPKKSILVVAPEGMGKRTFAYSVMKECVKLGKHTCSIIDTTQYRRQNIICSERPFSKMSGEFPNTLEQIHNADVLFITVDHLSYGNSLRVIGQLCDRRSRVSKPTIILSRYSPSQMCYLDRDFSDDNFINYQNKVDYLKYPSLIMIK